ncbi:MAG: bacteriohemerythrin [Magnetococcus sp. YQC-3]
MHIHKIEVANGIFWVEIPAANLRILCGSPMDSVKHLMKQGLIAPTEKLGVACETGPNAILLSDRMLQNGEFANLGEFPVLQMLYKQGLMLPGHPNNTGQKPLLIGSAEQVNAQMQYIYRGNYGLVSREEMMEAGMNPAETERMMRLKLRFAFGTIRPSWDLLDMCIVDSGPVEIQHGVVIRRTAANLFELAYAGETVTVDLNLAAGEHYESAYPLGDQLLPRPYFAVVHSGGGDGWDINRPSMSSILIFKGKIYLIDAGPNLFNNLAALGIGIDEVEGIFHTHAHDDHFSGVTTLMRAGRKVKYFATRIVRASVAKKVAALLSIEEEAFKEFVEVRDLELGAWNEIDGLEVRPLFSPHPVETTIFQFRTPWEGAYVSYAHYADIISLDVLEKMVEDDPGKPGIDRAFFEQVRTDYLFPVNLKKLDVGGGLIHGVAKDFKGDKSDRIVLAHMARAMTPEEREIGSSASHGTLDVLIAGTVDFTSERAEALLQRALPMIPGQQLPLLLNNPIRVLEPNHILFQVGEIPRYVYLVLTGAAEKIDSGGRVVSRLEIGTLLGEVAVLARRAIQHTYKTAHYVRALCIPVEHYKRVIVQNHCLEHSKKISALRSFFQSTWLFSEGVSSTILGEVVQAVQVRHFKPGVSITNQDLVMLNLIKSGSVERSVAGETVGLLHSGDCFGEEEAVFERPSLCRLRSIGAVEVYQIPGERIRDIPIVRWKLFEAYMERTVRMICADEGRKQFYWNSAFHIKIMEMDLHHKKLVEIANTTMEILRAGNDRGLLLTAFATLVNYTEYHFSAEERLMERYHYPELEKHRQQHRYLAQQVLAYREDIQHREDFQHIDFRGFFTIWLARHILHEDLHYGMFLNAQGVY